MEMYQNTHLQELSKSLNLSEYYGQQFRSMRDPHTKPNGPKVTALCAQKEMTVLLDPVRFCTIIMSNKVVIDERAFVRRCSMVSGAPLTGNVW